MAPSNNKGKLILSGLLKGTKFYNLDLTTRSILFKGIEFIIKNSINSGAKIIYHLEDAKRVEDFSDIQIKNKFIENCINKTLSSVHVMASASIGEQKKLCPLNSNGMIDGINNLLVADFYHLAQLLILRQLHVQ